MVEQRSPKPLVWVQLLLPLPYCNLVTVGKDTPAKQILNMAVVAKWLTHRIVAPAFMGSIPIDRPIDLIGD